MRSVLAALAALATTLAAAQGTPELPDLGNPADAVMSQSDEYRIGLTVVRQLREQGQILDDPEITEYIQALGSRVAAQATDGSQRFTFLVIKDPSINAFALPGGFIGVNQGLVLATETESQLAGVLAHEVAHVTQRHIARSVRAQGRQSIATTAMMIAAILLGAAGGGDAAQAAIAIAQGSAVQQQINYTRANEYEADRVGIGYLAAAGFETAAMPQFFEIMGRRSGAGGQQVPEFLQTHPVTANRIAESKARALEYPRARQGQTLTYDLVRERLRVVGGPDDADVRPYYAARRESRQPGPGQLYGEALALLEADQGTDAAATLAALYDQYEGHPMLAGALGQAQLGAGDTQGALATFREALRVAPRNVPLTVRYAEALMDAGDAKEAHRVLLDLFNVVPPTPDQIRLIALAASSAGDTGDAYYYLSEYHVSTGNLPLAVQQLELAVAAPNLNSVQRQRFQARLDELRDILLRSDRNRNRPPRQGTLEASRG
jgi:predicted Zn-dependent protease